MQQSTNHAAEIEKEKQRKKQKQKDVNMQAYWQISGYVVGGLLLLLAFLKFCGWISERMERRRSRSSLGSLGHEPENETEGGLLESTRMQLGEVA